MKPKPKPPYRPKDVNQLAKYIMELSTGGITEEKQLATVKPAKKKKAKKKG